MKLREPFQSLERDIIETLRGGEREGTPDLHSLYRGVEAMIRKYDIKLRPSPLDRDEIGERASTCPVCRLPTGSHVVTLQRFDETRQEYAHPECVNRKVTP